MAVDRALVIAGLRSRLQALSAVRRDEHWSSGWPELDRALGGGFAPGAVHELVDGCPAGIATTVALRLAARGASNSNIILYIDLCRELYPPGVEAVGVPLDKLLILRPEKPLDALWAAEQALRCRRIAALVMPLTRLAPAASRRLQLAAESGGGLAFVVRPLARLEPTFAATRLQVDPLPGTPLRVRVAVHKQRHQPRQAAREVILALDSDGGLAPAARRSAG